MSTKGHIRISKKGENERYFIQCGDGYPECVLCELSRLIKPSDTYNGIIDKLSERYEVLDRFPSDNDIEWQYHIDLDNMKIVTYYHTFISLFNFFNKRKRLFRTDDIGTVVKKDDIEQWDDEKYYSQD